MKTVLLGRSGLRVAELCLGTMTFGDPEGFGATEAESRQIFDRYREAGGNFLDTANIYTGGTSERWLGDFVRAERDALVVATKYSMSTDRAQPNCGGNHRKNLVQALEASLRRLGTDYIDLYWLHGWDQLTRIDEVMSALDAQVRAGKILHLGVSNCPAWLIARANTLADERGMAAFTAVQAHYNLVERGIEADFFDLCREHDMALTAWSPLAGGLLTGKFNADAAADAADGARLTKVDYGARLLSEPRLAVATAVAELAAEIGCSPSRLALAWLRNRPQGRVIPIIGARTLQQLDDNLGSLDVELAPDHVARLDALAPPAPAYPASLFATDFYRTMLHGDRPVEPD